jgi:hypothetical protein
VSRRGLSRKDFERRKQHPYDELEDRWQLLWRCLIAVLVGFFLAWASEKILPAGEAAKRLLAKAYLPWLTASDASPIEGLLPRVMLERTSYPPAVRDEEVLVMSIDDADLESMGIKWPPDLSVYAWMIQQLQRDGARAIFLDILLIDPRPQAQVDALRDAACAAARAGVPVFLASIPGQVVTGSPESILRQLPEVLDVNGKKRPCVELASPFTSEDRFDRSAWEYPLCGRGVPSAALALACAVPRRALTGRVETPPCPLQPEIDECRRGAGTQHISSLEDTDPEKESKKKQLALVWPAKGSAHNQKLLIETVARSSGGENLPEYQYTCNLSLPPSRYLLPLAMLMPTDWPPEWVTAKVFDTAKQILPEAKSRPLCPYTDVLPLRTLVGYGMKADERRKIIDGRRVLVGLSFLGHGDRHTVPLHESMAGVQVHAMALDNLLTYGTNWRQAGEFNAADWRDPATRYAVLSVLLMVLGVELQRLLAGMARTLERTGKTPWSDWFFGSPRWMPRWLTSAKNLLLAVFSLGRLPAQRRGRLPLLALVGFVFLSITLWSVLIGLLFFMANDLFRVGPLSQVEYVLAPLALGFVDQAHRLARGAVLLWTSGRLGRPAQFVREFRDVHEDEVWAHERRQDVHTPPTASTTATPPDATPTPRSDANDALS